MTDRSRLRALFILAVVAGGAGCSGGAANPYPRATRAPDVRCLEPAQPGSPGQDPNARPMFFFFCMQGP